MDNEYNPAIGNSSEIPQNLGSAQPLVPPSQDVVPPVPSVPPPPSTPPPQIPEEENSFMQFLSTNLKKIVIGLAAVFIFLFLIFGIILPNLSKNKNQIVTLTYWGLWEDAPVMSQVISDFERQNPNIKIVYSKEDIKDYRERLVTRISNGNGPDIFRFHNTWYPMLSNFLVPIPQNVISKDDFVKSYPQVAQKDLIQNGAIYGIPLEIDTLSLYVNRELFQSAGQSVPVTWEEFRDASRALTVKDEAGKIKTAGAAMGTMGNVAHAPDIISLLMIQNGAIPTDLTSYQRQVVDALRFYVSFASDDSTKVWDSTLDNSLLAFSKGNLAMFIGYSWDFFTIKALNPQLSFSTSQVPQLDRQNPVSLASYWAEGVSGKSTHQKEAMAFIKFLSLEATQQKIYTEEAKTRVFGEPYANINLAKSLQSDQNVGAFVSQAKTAQSSYFVDNTFDTGLNSKLNNYLTDSVNAILGNSSPESATATLFQGYSQVLKEYGR